MTLRLGLDTGGTCTDAVLVDDGSGSGDGRVTIRASAKTLTTHRRLIDGLRDATQAVLGAEDARKVKLVALSTTLATNALVEGRGRPVGLVLIGYTPERLLRSRLGEALGSDPVAFVAGGHTAAGERAADLDVAALEGFAVAVDERVEAWAISAVFGVRNPEHEREAADILRRLSGKPVSTGHRLSKALDAPRRALTTLLNARLIPMIENLLDATDRLLGECGIDAPVMIVKGDGSLITARLARELPVETILSGPAASVVGARHLHGLDDCVVADIGGTTTDVARIRGGRPSLDARGATVGGWRTMVEAIDIQTVGLGGDSEVLAGPVTSARSIRITLGVERAVPLALLGTRTDIDVAAQLRRQLERGRPRSHDGRFALSWVSAVPVGLAATQSSLLARLLDAPLPLESLHAERTIERALGQLESRGLVRRAAFTPTDAAHVLGLQSHWNAQASHLGAALLLRELESTGGAGFGSVEELCQAVIDEVSLATALVIAGCAPDLREVEPVARAERRRWLESSFRGAASSAAAASERLLTLSPTLGVPVIGIGASAALFHPRAAALLNTDVELSDYAGVANALGAVVGVVRQQRALTILPAGGKRVRVLLDGGPQDFETLEAGVAVATDAASAAALDAVRLAGAGEANVSCERRDTVVERDGEPVFFESVITATAIGRPDEARPMATSFSARTDP